MAGWMGGLLMDGLIKEKIAEWVGRQLKAGSLKEGWLVGWVGN